MTFGDALEKMKRGSRIARDGWNGKGMWLILVHAGDWTARGLPEGEGAFELTPWIMMKTADNKLVPWLASQTDMLAEDWVDAAEAS